MTKNVNTDNIENNEIMANIEPAENNEPVATLGRFTYKFSSPVNYNGTEVSELEIDLDALTGRDARAIEEELKAQGKFTASPAFDNAYLCKALAKACKTLVNEKRIGDDLFLKLGLRDYNKLCGKARAFFISSEA